MITRWKLQNFKSVRNETELKFAPLTIFAGANSTGKSSWIQSIMMVSQTFAHKISSRSVVLNGSLVRLGQFSDLKSFSAETDQIVVGWECQPREVERVEPVGQASVPYGVDPSKTTRGLYFGQYPGQIKKISCQIAFDTNGPLKRSEIVQLRPSLASSTLLCTTQRDENPDTESKVRVNRRDFELPEDASNADQLSGPGESEVESFAESFNFEVILDEKSLEEVKEPFASANLVGCTLQHFLPRRLTLLVDSVKEHARAIATFFGEGLRFGRLQRQAREEIVVPPSVIEILQRHLGDNLRLLLKPGLQNNPALNLADFGPVTLRECNEIVRSMRPLDRYRVIETLRGVVGLTELIFEVVTRGQAPKFRFAAANVPNMIIDGAGYLDFFFTTAISFLGPLRDEPKALYPLTTSVDLEDVGLRGEYTVAVLDVHKNRTIRYIPPDRFANSSGAWDVSSNRLEAAVTDWLEYLGVAESLHTYDKGKLGHEIRVKTPGVSREHDLTHAGVGLSQVLPILVSCLLASPDSTLLFEQPELHLHPRVQTRLGDFFLSMALLGKQCVIETHSEYLISRLRYRMASAPASASLSPLVKLYFAEKNGDVSNFREVVINEYGAISDWPEGFFDQSQDEAENILRAAAEKVQIARKKQE